LFSPLKNKTERIISKVLGFIMGKQKKRRVEKSFAICERIHTGLYTAKKKKRKLENKKGKLFPNIFSRLVQKILMGFHFFDK